MTDDVFSPVYSSTIQYFRSDLRIDQTASIPLEPQCLHSGAPALSTMLLFGLTGSIATGKSSVSNILRAPPYNLPVIDADILARKVVEPGTPGYQKVLDYFLSTTPDLLLAPSECGGDDGPDGRGRPLNRPALGRRVFGSEPEKQKDRAVLGKIVHPAVKREMYKAIFKCYWSGCWAVVLDIPLLFESGWERICGTVMVVAVSRPEVQMQRLRDRDAHLSEEDARNRVLSQMDVREKAERAMKRGGSGVVVWNDGDKEQLKRQVDQVMLAVRRNSPNWWAWLLLLCPPVAGMAGLYNFIRSLLIQRQWEAGKKSEKAKL